MNRHEDELEQKIADKYIENMDAPDLWGRIEAGLDAVDAQRVQDKNVSDSHVPYENREMSEERKSDGNVTDIRTGRKDGDTKLHNTHNKGKNRRTAQIISGLVAAAVVCVLIIAGPLRNSQRSASDKSVQENNAMVASDESTGGSDMAAESYSDAESDAAPTDDIQSDDAQAVDGIPESYDVQNDEVYQNETARNDYSISDSETNGKAVSDKPVVVTSSDQQGDYAPMIMVDGVLYKDTYAMVDADSIDETKVLYAESYTDGVPANDGEVNFDRNPSRNSAYVVCDDGSLTVNVEGNWYRFERAE